MECNRTNGQIVLPVFYDVDPSEVRHQTGEFGKAFQDLLSKITENHEFVLESVFSEEINEGDDMIKWKEALRQAASLAGFVVLNTR
jgi:hypothetical protein